ncbi:MAG: hypothetical protein ACLRZ9_05945 [Eubacterium sp.]
MQELKENIKELSKYVFEDIETLRSYDSEKVNKRIGSEVMSLNALVNTYKVLNENG